MDKCKTKAIQTGFGTFRHNQAYPGITQAYSKPCVTLTYLEPWYIQNPNIFKIRIIFRTLVYLELWNIQNPKLIQTSAMKRFVKIVYGKQFRSVSLTRSLFHEINIMRYLLLRQLLYVKKTIARESAEGREFLIYLHSNKLAYFQLKTVSVYGKIPLKSHNKVT